MPRRFSSARSRFTLAIAIFALVAVGCDSSSSGDTEATAPNIAGSWSGVASLPNPFSVSMSLAQRGRVISGTARLPSRQTTVIEGEINASDRFAWEVQIGCEQWSGSLAIDEAAREMSGAINLNGGSCQPATDASGTLRLSK